MLAGGTGFDRIVGGLGRDRISGGIDNDAFVYASAAEAGRGAARDIVEDFQHNRDTFDLRGIDASTAAAGDQTFAFIGAAAFGGWPGSCAMLAGSSPAT